MANILYLKQLADNLNIDYSSVDEYLLGFESTWIGLLGGVITSGGGVSSTFSAIQNEVDAMPDKENLIGIWFPGYDATLDGEVNNQVVQDFSGNENNGLRGGSLTVNTSSPNLTSFDGVDDKIIISGLPTTTQPNMTIGIVFDSKGYGDTGYMLSRGSDSSNSIYKSSTEIQFYMFDLGRYNNINSTGIEHWMGAATSSYPQVYKDGVLQSPSATGIYSWTTSSGDFSIGNYNASNSHFWRGDIHCVYYYSANVSANAAAINTSINNCLAIIGGQ